MCGPMASSPGGVAQMTEALRASTSGIRAIFEAGGDAVFTTDEHGTIVEFNKAAEEMFGYAADEAIGRHTRMLWPETHLNGFTGLGQGVIPTLRVARLHQHGLREQQRAHLLRSLRAGGIRPRGRGQPR